MAARELVNTSLFNDSSLVSYYKLENANDSKGSNTLTNNNSVPFNAAKFNNGADFGTGNTNKSLTRSDTLGLSSSASRSIRFWAKITTELSGSDTYHVLVAISHADIDISFRIGYWRDGGVNKVAFDRGKNSVATTPITTNTSLGTANYHHFVLNWNGTTLEGFLDGASIGTSTPSGNGSDGWADGFSIGCDSQATFTQYHDAIIDDVAVFSRVLTSQEVADDYNGVNSVSPSASTSPSVSKSPSISPSVSPSVSKSPSVSPSSSLSPSISPSISASPSLSPSISPSISVSPSLSPSISPSSSKSPSVSPSSSISPSVSLSPSISPSPSPGWSVYTRDDRSALPTNNDDFDTIYSEDEELIVSTRDNTYVSQTGALQYMLHEFKNYVGSETQCSIQWEGKSTLAPSSSTVYMQIYNESSGAWETIDYNSTSPADIDFELCAKVASLINYKNLNNVISCRVYQLAI